MNYCLIYKINIRGNFIWKSPWSEHILGIQGSIKYCPKRARCLKKGHQKFLSVLNRNKTLYNFCKRQQRSKVQRNIGLQYTLLVASNSHISTTLSHLLSNVNDSKGYALTVPMILPFKVLKHFFSGKISFFLFACLW